MERNVNKLAKQVVVLCRRFSSKTRPKVILDEQLRKALENGELKPRKHYGVNRLLPAEIPENIKTNIQVAMQDVPSKNLKEDADNFCNYLWSRHAPAEVGRITEVTEMCRKQIIKEIEEKNKAAQEAEDDETNTEEPNKENETKSPLGQKESEDMLKRANSKLQKSIKEKIYSWEAINYNKYFGLKYLLGRSAPEYAALLTILQEIIRREPDFQPQNLFDFGSGVGTVSWAVLKNFKKSIREIFSVDTSRDMNDLARLVLNGGETNPLPVPRYFQRQFLPSMPVPYDLVISSYALFELPSMKSRLETILNLWRRTSQFLILVEMGTNAGFHILEEARAFILEQKDDDLVGHIFAPCPHDSPCPRFEKDHTPCNFLASYIKLSFTKRMDTGAELYSYVVFKKGRRPDNPDKIRWPRIVRPPIIKSKHAICRMCCADGNLQEVIFTAKKFDLLTYRCSKHSNWGDRLPVEIINPEIDSQHEDNKKNEL